MLLVLFATSKAQYFNYLASNASVNVAGTYTDLGTSGTKITTNFSGAPMGNIDDNSSVQQIGFSFNFSGINFTEFVLNTNGFIRLGNRPTAISASHDVLFSTDTTATNVIYPFNINLQPTGNTEFRVFTTGTAGSKTCTIQFKALTDSGCPVNCNPAADIQYDNVDFQIILREGSNNIEFVYGNFIANGNLSGFVPTNCGLKLNDASRSINATKASTTAYASTAFLNGAYTGNRFNTRNSILPSSGFTIQFIPVPVLNNNVTVQTLYSMGKVPKNFDQSVSVIVQNVGTTNFTNFPVTLSVSGANTFNNTHGHSSS